MATYDAAAVARLDKLYSAPQVVEQRQRLRALLGARPGEKGLDIGCGAGHLACELAHEVAPGGRIFALDSSADSVSASNARALSKGVSITVQTGEATALPFDDAIFDFAVAVQVYCYVREIAVALREAARVIRVGGRLAILDTDWDACFYRSADDALTRRLIASRAQRRFEHAHLPRHLPALLHAAGLRLTATHVIPIIETQFDPDSFGAGLLGPLRDEGRDDQIANGALRAWEAEMRSRTRHGEWFFYLNRFVFIADRTGGA